MAFNFVTETAGIYVITTAGSDYDTVLSLYGSDCTTLLECNDDSGSLQSRLQVSLLAGAQFVVVIDGYNAGSTGNYVLNIVTTGTVLYRVNCGGPEIAANDGGIPWSADSGTNPSPYADGSLTNSVEFNTSTTGDSTVPTAVPNQVLRSERYDPNPNSDPMGYDFMVPPGTYYVRVYLAENWFNGAGSRIFDVSSGFDGGSPMLFDFDIAAEVGARVGTMRSAQRSRIGSGVEYSLGVLFEGVLQNPCVNAIEIVRW